MTAAAGSLQSTGRNVRILIELGWHPCETMSGICRGIKWSDWSAWRESESDIHLHCFFGGSTHRWQSFSDGRVVRTPHRPQRRISSFCGLEYAHAHTFPQWLIFCVDQDSPSSDSEWTLILCVRKESHLLSQRCASVACLTGHVHTLNGHLPQGQHSELRR